MTGQQLKNSILQMAVQGKLVPQDPNDEPASVLLERIRAEKEQLIKEGKIKKEKNPSYIFRGADNLPYEKIGNNEPVCIADEVPFDIPDSWEWVRLGSISTYADTKKKTNAQDAPKDMWGLDLEDIEKGGKLLERKTVGERNAKGDKTFFSKGDILYSKLRPYLLKILVAPDDGICTSEIVPFKMYGDILSEYIVMYLKSPSVNFLINSITYGVKMPRVGTETMVNLLVPIPPINEQKSIMTLLNKVTPYINNYSAIETSSLALSKSFPDQLKKSILQQAVMGKLVPQDLNDEPASVLLERIRAEKQQLIKDGKIKKDKHESVIFKRDNSHYEKLDGIERCIDDEIPFEIPDNWYWVRLKNICAKLVDGDHNPPAGVAQKTKYLMLSASNINENTLCEFDKVRYLSKEIFEKENERTNVATGDIFLTSVGTLGRSCVYTGGYNICFQRSVSVITTLIYNFYLKYFFDNPITQFFIKSNASGTAQKGFYLKQLEQLLIPVPPITEQQRIVVQIEKILPTIEKL